MTVERLWPASWLATLKHVYGNPDRMFATRWTAEEGGPVARGYAAYEAVYLDRMLRDENALNDVLNLTMALMPDGFHQRLADRLAPGVADLSASVDVTHDYREHYRYAERSGKDLTQPDHLRSGPAGTMGIELKTASRSNLKQLLHYTVLAAMDEEIHGKPGSHLLVLLTSRATLQASMEGDNVVDAATARQAMLAGAAAYHAKAPRHLFTTLDRLVDTIPRMTVVHVSFQDFVRLLREEFAGSSGPAESTLRKLVDGAAAEFERHQALSRVRPVMDVIQASEASLPA